MSEAEVLKKLRGEGLVLTPRHTWGTAHERVYEYRMLNDYYRLSMPLDYLFLHISVTTEVGDTKVQEYEAMRIIERVGYDRFKSGFSYNSAAHDTGRLMLGMPFTAKGTHTVNDKQIDGFPYDLNRAGHAICLPQVEATPVTDKQVDSLAKWGAALKRAGVNNVKGGVFYPHLKFAWKACPGAKMVDRLSDLNDKLNDYIKNGLEGADMPLNKEDLDKIEAASYRGTVKALDEKRYEDRDSKDTKRSISGTVAELEQRVPKS